MHKQTSRFLTVVFLFLLSTSLFVGVCTRLVRADYSVTIWAWDALDSNGYVSEPIWIDGSLAGSTPFTKSLTAGSHTISAPYSDSDTNLFNSWNNGVDTYTQTISSPGTYTALYACYHVTIKTYDPMGTWGSIGGLKITEDGADSGYVTPHTVTGLTGSHTFSVPSSSNGYPFSKWDNGVTSRTLNVDPNNDGATFAAYYMNPLTVSITPTPWIMDVGQSKQFTAKASGGTESYSSYQWATPLGNNFYLIIPGETSLNHNLVPTASGSSTFVVQVTDSLGETSQYSSPTSVTVNSALSTPSAVASAGTINQGQSSTLSFTGLSGGTAPYSYQWLQKAPGAGSYSAISGATSNTYSFSTSTSTTKGSWSFEVQVKDSASSPVTVTSNAASVTVNALPVPSVSVTPSSGTMDIGQSKTFTANPSGGSGSYSSYQWYVDGTAQSGATSSTFDYSPASTGSHSITVTVTDSSGTTSPKSTAATVTVNAQPSVSVSPSSWVMDVGQSELFTATASGGSGTYTSYQWYVNGTAVSEQTASTFNYSASSAGSFSITVTVTDSLGATSPQSPSASVTVNLAMVAPTISASASLLDQGQTSTLSSSAITTGTLPYTYQWFSEAPGASSFTSIDHALSNSYSFDMTTMKATGSWSLLLMVNDSAGASVNSTAISITLNRPLSQPSASPSLGAINQGQSSTLSFIDLTGGCTPYIYQWFQKAPNTSDYSVINGATSSTYIFSTSSSTATGTWNFIVQVTDSASSPMMINSTVALVTVNSGGFNLATSVSPASWAMDVGQSKQFTVTASGGSGSYTSYQWYVNGAAQSGQTAQSFTYSPPSAGSASVTVTVTDSLGTTSPQSSPASVTVNAALASPSVSISSSTVSQGQTSTLTGAAVTSGTSPYTYQWLSEAPGASSYSQISGATSSSYSFVTSSSTATSSWSFMLQVTDNTGASINSAAATVTVTSPGVTPSPSAVTPSPSKTTPSPSPLVDFGVNASAGPGGTISPAGAMFAYAGSSFTFTITPSAGYQILDVKDNGVSKGALHTYELSNIRAMHEILVTFSQISASPTSSPSNGSGGTFSLMIVAVVVLALAAITATTIIIVRRRKSEH